MNTADGNHTRWVECIPILEVPPYLHRLVVCDFHLTKPNFVIIRRTYIVDDPRDPPAVYVCETLLDQDRTNDNFYIFNASDETEEILGCYVSFHVYYPTPLDLLSYKNLYPFPVFSYFKNEWFGHKIEKFRISTEKANGIDIEIFAGLKGYLTLEAKGTKYISLPIRKDLLKNRPFTFMLRSRYTKMGAIVEWKDDVLAIYNHSKYPP